MKEKTGKPALKERPMLFSAPMVRALLDGSKTQTRRVMKPQPEPIPHRPGDYWWPCNAFQSMVSVSDTRAPGAHGMAGDACQYGAHGDHLWVRETWHCDHFEVQKGPYLEVPEARELLVYRADSERPYEAEQPVWRPSIHMPRWASRILLEIISVRVERLNDCSEVDALAEGVKAEPCDHVRLSCEEIGCCGPTAKGMYAALWDQINGAGAWAVNPWVWVVEFKRVTP